MSNNVYERPFLSAGGSDYRASSSRQPSLKEILWQLRACKNDLARTIITLQQIAYEQEHTEQHDERLTKGAHLLIEVVQQPVAGTVLTQDRIVQRNQAIVLLREMLGGARLQGESTDKTQEIETTPFQTQFQAAMHALVDSADYEYRKHFPELAKSIQRPTSIGQTGLSSALQTALVDYAVPDDPEAMNATVYAATGEDLAESIQVDAAWRAELTAATTTCLREHFNLERFKAHLTRARIPGNVETLKQHIAAAFISYHKRCEVGIAPDSWDLML